MKSGASLKSDAEDRYGEYADRFKQNSYARSYSDDLTLDSTRDLLNLRKLTAVFIARAETRAIRKMTRASRASCVLDAPCGSGKIVQSLLDSGLVVVGVDSSREMLSRCPKRRDHLEVVQGDLRFMPMKNDSVQVAICNRFLHRIPPDRHKATLDEFGRVTSRYAIFYFAIEKNMTSMVCRMERLLRLGDRGRIHYMSRDSIREELSNNGWRFLRATHVVRMLSSGYVVLAEKRGTQ